MIPTNATGVLILLGLVVPGFVHQAVRRRFRGPTPDERDTTARIIRAFATSAVLAFLYVVALGSRLTNSRMRQALEDNPRLIALLALLLLFVVPTSIAVVQQLIAVSSSPSDALRRLRERRLSTYDPTPTAWDFTFTGLPEGWIRVLSSDGTWIGGWFGEKSYASSYPEPRELFIELQFRMGSDGEFVEAIDASGGVYVRCDDVRAVEYISAP